MYYGHAVEARYDVAEDGTVTVSSVRLETERNEDLGWISRNFSFSSLSVFHDYISSKPAFIASDLGEVFLFALEAPTP